MNTERFSHKKTIEWIWINYHSRPSFEVLTNKDQIYKKKNCYNQTTIIRYYYYYFNKIHSTKKKNCKYKCLRSREICVNIDINHYRFIFVRSKSKSDGTIAKKKQTKQWWLWALNVEEIVFCYWKKWMKKKTKPFKRINAKWRK